MGNDRPGSDDLVPRGPADESMGLAYLCYWINGGRPRSSSKISEDMTLAGQSGAEDWSTDGRLP